MLKNDLYENLVHYWARKDKAYVERSSGNIDSNFFKSWHYGVGWDHIESVNFTYECIGKIFPSTAELIFFLLLNNVLCPLFLLSDICKLENVNTCTYMLNFSVLHELLVHLHLYSELSSQAKNMAKAYSVYHICLPSVHLIPFSFSLRELFRTC